MTLIIGIKCANGVVMAADGAATFVAMGQDTIRQPMRKLQIVDDGAVIGVSGPGSLAQQYASILKQILPQLQAEQPRHHVALLLQSQFWSICQPAMMIAQQAQGIVGPNLARQSALSGAVVAFPLGDDLALYQLNQQCAPEEATADLPFVAIGSGQSIADPFLAFLRKVFWPNRLPTVADARFAAYWTLGHAIETNPGGVADPKQMITIQKSGSSYDIHELTREELLEHEGHIQQANDHLRQLPQLMQPGGQVTTEMPIPSEIANHGDGASQHSGSGG